ncbi:MAG: phosphoribosylaminoimidazolesuccinocarboxamide synthase [Bacteroidetes bacterium]|jgi:phosphoribosylaminoimidazole-succinocarboxamide synthase|nr:MAG: phosphoribosylaminoimidazolesuccinocarboxamide synthase [Bacteroidota bacterium]
MDRHYSDAGSDKSADRGALDRVSRHEALENCIAQTEIPGFRKLHQGKVRDVYELSNERIALVATDRISAFDAIMGEAIPFKGQILNRLSSFFFDGISDLCSTHFLSLPHPNVMIAKRCDPVPIEVVVRGYLTGHAWRVYRDGGRFLCGVQLPDGMREHEAFSSPIITPATKAVEGHDEDIPEVEILSRGLVEPTLWEEIRETALRLFRRGTAMASERGLILVDTKYEFGLYQGKCTLMDEVHTTDSSRYFYASGYSERLKRGERQHQLSKEYLREWLLEQGFSGLEGQTLPHLPETFRWSLYERYKELYEMMTGQSFEPVPLPSMEEFNREFARILQDATQS